MRQLKRRRVPQEVKVEQDDRHTPSSGHYTRGKHVRVYYDESMSETMEDTSREATPPRCCIFVWICMCVRVYYDESMSETMEDTSREATPPRCCICACIFMHVHVGTTMIACLR